MLITKKMLVRAREISTNLSQGINPLTNQPIDSVDFLEDPKMIRYFSFISEVLTNDIEGNSSKKGKFYIKPEEIDEIKLPEGDITISVFTDAVNNSIHLAGRKKLTAVFMNKQLKKMGLLRTDIEKSGKKCTRTTDTAEQYGIIEVEIEREERSYFRILYNEKGKVFLKDNLIDILAYEGE